MIKMLKEMRTKFGDHMLHMEEIRNRPTWGSGVKVLETISVQRGLCKNSY